MLVAPVNAFVEWKPLEYLPQLKRWLQQSRYFTNHNSIRYRLFPCRARERDGARHAVYWTRPSQRSSPWSHKSAQEPKGENRTNKYSTYHDEEHAETKHQTHADIHSTTTSCSFLPAPRSTKKWPLKSVGTFRGTHTTEEINNSSCLECCQNDDPPVMQEIASKEQRKTKK